MRYRSKRRWIPGSMGGPALLVPALLAIHACGPSDQSRPGGTLLAWHGEEPAPPARRVEGELVLDGRGCLRAEVDPSSLEGGDPERPTIVVPAGYDFDLERAGGAVTVLDEAGRTAFRDGGRIEAVGGYVEAPLSSVAGMSGVTAGRLEDQCAGSYLYADDVVGRSG